MAFVATIKSAGQYLSCTKQGTSRVVEAVPKDDGSGRQRWLLTPVGPDTYVVTTTASGRAAANTLSCSAAGGRVDLYGKDDGSGRQHWTFLKMGGNRFTVSVNKGLRCAAERFLTFSNAGKVALAARNAPGAGAANQQFVVAKVGEGPPTPTPAPSPKPVFLGGAFDATCRSLALEPARWSGVAARTAFWAHPMGVGAAMDGNYLPALLSRFGVKKFFYEQDLLAWSDGSNPTQTNTPQ